MQFHLQRAVFVNGLLEVGDLVVEYVNALPNSVAIEDGLVQHIDRLSVYGRRLGQVSLRALNPLGLLTFPQGLLFFSLSEIEYRKHRLPPSATCVLNGNRSGSRTDRCKGGRNQLTLVLSWPFGRLHTIDTNPCDAHCYQCNCRHCARR